MESPALPVEEPPPSLTLPLRCAADGVWVGSVEISDQAQLDALEGCERIAGSVRLRLFEDIDEAPLLSLRSIEGTLEVSGAAQPTQQALDGLRSLEQVGVAVLLSALSVTDLEPLARLQRIGVSEESGVLIVPAPAPSPGLQVSECAGLTSLAGLHSLEHVRRIALIQNPDLVSLAGLDRLRGVEELTSRDCPVLDLEGLELLSVQELSLYGTALSTLAGLGDASQLHSLTLGENAALVSLEGGVFPAHLDRLELIDNDALQSLKGLEALREVDSLTLYSSTGQSDLASLEGLDGLEQVGDFGLNGQARLPHLSGLSALREVRQWLITDNAALIDLVGAPRLQRLGRLSLLGAPALQGLQGLGTAAIGDFTLDGLPITNLAGLEQVSVVNLGLDDMPRLTSLSGLASGSPTGGVAISQAPALEDVQALASVSELQFLLLGDTGLENLDALAALRRLESLYIHDNAQLSQLDGLSGLVRLGYLQVADNPSLRTLPRFNSASAASCAECSSLTVSIRQNQALESWLGAPLLEGAESIEILENPALTELSGFNALRSVRQLVIRDNPKLNRLELGPLESAGSVLIRGNAALDDGPLAPLRLLPLGQVKIVSNLPGPSQLSPCPWVADGTCDEQYGDCAPGTDAQDCVDGN